MIFFLVGAPVICFGKEPHTPAQLCEGPRLCCEAELQDRVSERREQGWEGLQTPIVSDSVQRGILFFSLGSKFSILFQIILSFACVHKTLLKV